MKRCLTVATVLAISFFVVKWLLSVAGQDYFVRGNEHYDLENYTAAVEAYTVAIEIDPTQVLYFFNQGLRFVDMNETRRARTDFQRARHLARADSDDKLAGKILRELRLLP